jgi:DNA-binding NarL/FixJ family response regulator
VVGEAESVDQARRRALAVRPAVAVVAGAQLCPDLRLVLPAVRCLVLGQDVSPEAVAAAMRAGASGYLVKDVRSTEIVAAVRRVAAGHTLFVATTPSTSEPTSDRHHRDPLTLLTDRERQLLQLLGEGLSNREIAERLRLEVKTVKNYVTTVLAKLHMTNRTQAAVLATQLRNCDGATCPERRLPRLACCAPIVPVIQRTDGARRGDRRAPRVAPRVRVRQPARAAESGGVAAQPPSPRSRRRPRRRWP